MKIYHAEQENDKNAQRYAAAERSKAEQAGGELSVSRGFGNQPAILVLQAPDGIDPNDLLPGPEWIEVGDEQS